MEVDYADLKKGGFIFAPSGSRRRQPDSEKSA